MLIFPFFFYIQVSSQISCLCLRFTIEFSRVSTVVSCQNQKWHFNHLLSTFRMACKNCHFECNFSLNIWCVSMSMRVIELGKIEGCQPQLERPKLCSWVYRPSIINNCRFHSFSAVVPAIRWAFVPAISLVIDRRVINEKECDVKSLNPEESWNFPNFLSFYLQKGLVVSAAMPRCLCHVTLCLKKCRLWCWQILCRICKQESSVSRSLILCKL